MQSIVSTGIDYSVKSTAVVTLVDGQLHRCDIITPDPDASENYRYWQIGRDVLDIVTLMQPDIIGIEGFSLQSKGRAVSMLYGVGWAIRFGMMSEGLPFADVPPSTWKKYCGAGGGANKAKAVQTVRERWNFSHTVQDAYDAYAIAHLCADFQRGILPDTDTHVTLQRSILRNASK